MHASVMSRTRSLCVLAAVCLGGSAFGQSDDLTQAFLQYDCTPFTCITPVEVREPDLNNPIIDLEIGGGYYGSYAFAIFQDGSVTSWGVNMRGQRDFPPEMIDPSAPVQFIECNNDTCLALLADGRVYQWGVESFNQFNIAENYQAPGGARAIDADTSSWASVAIEADGTYSYQGYSDSSFSTITLQPLAETGLKPVKVALARETVGFVLEDGTVRIQGVYNSSFVPQRLRDPLDEDFVPTRDIVMHGNTGLALREDGSVVAFLDTSVVPDEASGLLVPVVALKIGDYDQDWDSYYIPGVTALRADGKVVTWYPSIEEVRVRSFDPQGQIAFCPDVPWSRAMSTPDEDQVGLMVAGVPVCLNQTENVIYDTLVDGINEASPGDLILAVSDEFDEESLGFFSAPVTAMSRGLIGCDVDERFRLGGLASLVTESLLDVRGEIQVLPEAACLISAASVDVAESGLLGVANGGDATIDVSQTFEVSGDAVVNNSGNLSVGPAAMEIQPGGDLAVLGGTVQAPVLRIDADGEVGRAICIDGTLSIESTQVAGGELGLVNSSIIGDLAVESGSGGSGGKLNATGYLFGDLTVGVGRCTTLDDFFVIGDLQNGEGGVVAVQAGTMYVSGGIVNQGQIYGEVIGAPGFAGGGQTAAGDGISLVGDLVLGPQASIRFSEPLWQIALGGDFDVAIESPSQFELIGSTLRLNGASGTVQRLEATSRDIGPDPAAFTAPPAAVSLIRRLEVTSDASVQVVDDYRNAGKKGTGREAIYTSSLVVEAGGSLELGDAVVYCTEADIQGVVDRPEQIVVVSILPDADFNDDGRVDGADLAFILAFWGSNDPDVDLNGDGLVDAFDLGLMLASWTG